MWFRRQNKKEDASEEALKDAQKNLHEIQKRSDEINRISTALKEIREKNHFAEALESIIIRRGESLR